VSPPERSGLQTLRRPQNLSHLQRHAILEFFGYAYTSSHDPFQPYAQSEDYMYLGCNLGLKLQAVAKLFFVFHFPMEEQEQGCDDGRREGGFLA
jgi:hypothetical protein